MAGWKQNNKNELVKLNSYSKTDTTDAEIPVVIPDAGKNARFKVTDLAPVYKDDENNCLKIEDGVISKTDTTYQSGDDVIKVNTVGNENIISCDGFGGKKYVAGTAIQVTETTNTTTNKATFSTLKSSEDKLMGNIQTHQKHQPTYRKNSKTEFSGFANLYGVIGDPWWSESTPDSHTIIARISGGRIHCYNSQIKEKTYYINGDTSSDGLYKFNQYAIHMARVGGIYVDYAFLTNHHNRELYITKSYTAFDANQGQNYGCKFYITENSGSSRRLRVIIYSCGYICEGFSTKNNPEICLQDISYWNWANGQNASTFNYILRPIDNGYKLRDFGYNAVCVEISNDGGAHSFIYSGAWYPDKYYDSNNIPCTIMNDAWIEYDYTWTYSPAIGWVPQMVPGTGVSYNSTRTITEYSNFYKKADPRYNYWQTANKIRTKYCYNTDIASTILYRSPDNANYGKYSRFLHEGEVHRNFNEVCPVSFDEYFSSFKFMVNGYGVTTVNGVDYDTVYLVDMRN